MIGRMSVLISCRNCISNSQFQISSYKRTKHLAFAYQNLWKVAGERTQSLSTRCFFIRSRITYPKLWSRVRYCMAVNALWLGRHNKDTQLSNDFLTRRYGLYMDLQIKRHFASPSATEANKRENILTVPNILCLVRIALAPMISCLLLNSEHVTALALLGVAGMTDLLDGFVARNFKNQSTVFGSMLDPVADKILMTVMTVSLSWVNLLPVYLCALIVGRDIGIMSAVAYLRYKTVPKPLTLAKLFDINLPTVQMKPTSISKVNTALQLGLVGLCMAAPVFNFTDSSLLHAYWYFVGTTTVLSGMSYVVKGSQTFKVLK